MNPPQSGLRRLFNNSKRAAKVSVIVPPGDELEVSEDVAAQLTAADPHIILVEDRDAKAQAAQARGALALDAEGKDDQVVADVGPEPADAAETLPAVPPRTKGRRQPKSKRAD